MINPPYMATAPEANESILAKILTFGNFGNIVDVEKMGKFV